MVNVKNLFGMAVVATALVGCSSSDDLATDVKGNENKAEAAYASFKINLPTTTGTRAVNPKTGTEFDGGTAAEYEVKNGTILIFDNSGKFVESAELGTMNPWTKDTDDNGVTTAAAVTVQLHNVKVGTSYKALVLLNNDVDATTKKVTLPSEGDSYYTWSATAVNTSKTAVNPSKYESTADGIFMANAPKYEATKDPTTLVDLNSVYASREQAQANPATVVYVERGLAKVTMDDFASNYPINAGTYKGDNVKIVNWQLDVTNKYTFPIHQADLKSERSAVWSEPRFYDNTSSAFKRVYWGTDPNYSGTDNLTLTNCKKAFNMIGNGDVKGLPGTPQYCLENTFDLDNMKQGQTTRVVFKAVYTPKTFTTGETFYKVANNTAVWKGDALAQQILTLAIKAMKITDLVEQAMYSVDLSKGSNISGVAGQHLIAADNIIFDPGSSTKTSKVDDGVIKEINEKLGLSEEDPTAHKEKVGISTYLNGEAYYIARIMHFNTLTPWEPGQPTYKDASRLTLEESNKKYLGRYGVLRNNWYSLSVHSISNLGYPEVPEVKPNVPDDVNDQYINVEVKILDWAKRSQSIDL